MSDFVLRLVAGASSLAPISSDMETPPNFDPRQDGIFQIRRSGLFDVDFHLRMYPDLAIDGLDPVEHFFDHGYAEGRRPNPYFDPAYYMENNPDVVRTGMHPLVHYILHGDQEGRRPCAVFEPSWYRSFHGLPEGVNTLRHYLEGRTKGPLSPVPAFDAVFYARSYPDVAAAGIDLFEHYINHGWKEGRDPSPEFDGRWYARRYLGGDWSSCPFFHWMEHRGQPGIHGRLPDEETSIPREVRRWTRPGPGFEDGSPIPPSAPRQAKVLAYYLPQFHSFRENDSWWGTGFTEWTNLPRGLPRFAGHHQPRVPRDLGFYRLDTADGTETLRRQARMARDAGVHGFVFYYYWFNGHRLMDGPLERLLADPSVDLPFALMWANENWTRRWDGAESEILISQDYRPEDDVAMVADFARHFRDPRYIRVEGGRPLLFLYRPGIIPSCSETVGRWRALFRDLHGEDPVIVMAQAFGDTDPRRHGLDGAVEFPPHKLTQHMPPVNHEIELLDPEFRGKIYHYDKVVEESLAEPHPDFPLIKCACPSWDNDARRQGSGLVITGSTPAKYEGWLRGLVERARRHPTFGDSFVCINAWNEWCEGAYLEPDLHWGSAYLNATGRAVAGMAAAQEAAHGLLLVGHDAFPSGAQTLLLSIGRMLRRLHGLRVEFLLLDGGAMEGSYRDVAPTTVMQPGVDPSGVLRAMADRGLRHAIVNTTAAGAVTPYLDAAGITPEVLLIHELPRILREKGLLPSLQRGFRHARRVIFPARIVEERVCEAAGERPVGTVSIMPQGTYKVLEADAAEAAAFRKEHGIPAGAPLAVGAGYGDFRKGLDLFLQVWRLANQDGPFHFLWAGQIAQEAEAWLGGEIAAARATGTFHTPGLLQDVAPAFAAADVFLLTSREDPFPTVALEALSLGRPVVAFGDSGGIPEMLAETGAGVVVPYGDTIAMAAALHQARRDGSSGQEERRRLVEERFRFAPYVSRLLDMALPGLPSVSVAVPNYNYARFMPDRLGSVFRQTHPVREVLVLDDVSSDDSLEVIPRVAQEWEREIRLIANRVNSGSVFAQWRKAAEEARGDWLWIAEADDSSEPEFIERLMTMAAHDPAVVMAFSDSRTMHADGTHQWDSYKGYYATVEADALAQSAVYEGMEFVSRFLSVKNLILNVSAVVWRREALLAALDALGPSLREFRMAGDWQLYLQALTVPGARIAYEARALNVHRRHAESVTHALKAELHLSEISRCHEYVRARVPGLPRPKVETQENYLREVRRQLGLEKIQAPSRSIRSPKVQRRK